MAALNSKVRKAVIGGGIGYQDVASDEGNPKRDAASG